MIFTHQENLSPLLTPRSCRIPDISSDVRPLFQRAEALLLLATTAATATAVVPTEPIPQVVPTAAIPLCFCMWGGVWFYRVACEVLALAALLPRRRPGQRLCAREHGRLPRCRPRQQRRAGRLAKPLLQPRGRVTSVFEHRRLHTKRYQAAPVATSRALYSD